MFSYSMLLQSHTRFTAAEKQGGRKTPHTNEECLSAVQKLTNNL